MVDSPPKSVMQRYFFAICGDPVSIDLQVSVNILPRNLTDKRKHVNCILIISKILHEYSNDLTRHAIDCALTYMQVL